MFQQGIKFDCLNVGYFLKFLLICDLYFWQISIPLLNVSKDSLNNFLVNSSVLTIFDDVKHIVVFFFVRLVF